jgi:hypothetical protein
MRMSIVVHDLPFCAFLNGFAQTSVNSAEHCYGSLSASRELVARSGVYTPYALSLNDLWETPLMCAAALSMNRL